MTHGANDFNRFENDARCCPLSKINNSEMILFSDYSIEQLS